MGDPLLVNNNYFWGIVNINVKMEHKNEMEILLKEYGRAESVSWLMDRIEKLAIEKSAKDLFMTYSILSSKFDSEEPVSFAEAYGIHSHYFKIHSANLLQIARMYLLSEVLRQDETFYTPKVANIIEVADTGELETFLKYLVVLPNPGAYRKTAVEALRTNIAVVFDAIALNNPYPAQHFNDQQWNQMYLKAAFMERDLSQIEAVDQRANEDLSRIIFDYAHERWAAGRTIDPLFWRPVSTFLNEERLKDMKRLLDSENIFENRAGALCCHHSGNEKALKVLDQYLEMKKKIANKEIEWNTLKH
ncbi:MAG: EboA domain-containing protein [Maribacter sp.]